jgi:hypothetical protein
MLSRNYCGRADCGCNDVEAETCPRVLLPGADLARPCQTLGGGRAHIYVTRTATLEWIALTHQRFEEGRRELMLRLLSAEPVLGDLRRWTFRVGLPTLPERAWQPGLGPRIYSFVAYVVPDGDLLVVANVALAQDAPRVHSSGPPSDGLI